MTIAVTEPAAIGIAVTEISGQDAMQMASLSTVGGGHKSSPAAR
jgi:hypothetical protein